MNNPNSMMFIIRTMVITTLSCLLICYISFIAADNGFKTNIKGKIEYEQSLDSAISTFKCNTLETENIKKQLKIVSARQRFHSDVASIYYKYYFMMSFSLVFFSTVCSFILFLIAKDGWNNTSSYLKTILFTCSFFASLMYTLPKVFKSDDNILKNKTMLKMYYQIQINTIDAVNVYMQGNCLDSLLIRDLLSSNYRFMQENQDIFIEIDSKGFSNPTDWISNSSKPPENDKQND